MALIRHDYCVVDTETTGGNAELSRVIDIAVYHVRDGIVLGKFQSLLNPGRPIPQWITMLTGIDDSMVKDAPTFDQIAGPLKEFLDRGVFVAHNASFDYRFIQCEYGRLGEKWERPKLCTVRMARKLYPELPSRSLGNLCEHLMIDIVDRHRAAGDAEATIYVLKHLLKRFTAEHELTTVEQLEKFLKKSKRKKTALT